MSAAPELSEAEMAALNGAVQALIDLHDEDSQLRVLDAMRTFFQPGRSAADWIDGLPTEPGRYYYALLSGADVDWRCSQGVTIQFFGDALRHSVTGDEHNIVTSDYQAIMHQPAPPLPEPPQ